MSPLLSIIIPAYNPGRQLLAALASVSQQSFTDYEVWVIDGGSSDGTVDVLKQTGPEVRWLSEPDSGIYEAMNKAIERSTGKWLFFLGSDDTLEPEILQKISALLSSDLDLIFGDVVFDNTHRFQSFLGPRTWFQNTVHHQSAFYHRSLFIDFRYDTTLKAIADYELNLRCYLGQKRYRYTPVLISTCRTGGVSSEGRLSCRETNTVRNRYLKNKGLATGLSLLLRAYYWQKQLRFRLYGHLV
jgi:putative colanic acid biosynthesis glycosyltransferase